MLKALRPWTNGSKQTSEPEQRRRFFTEVSTLKTLGASGCPRIATILDDNIEEEYGSSNILWYVMPYYRGGAMRGAGDHNRPGEFIESYSGNVDRVLSIACDLAETVEWMHSGSPAVLHRDIHTQNVFFGEPGGRPILGDFGLAASLPSPPQGGTRLDEAIGPRRWRPPEMRPGSEHKQNPASDIYMIGGVIYEALTNGRFIEDTQDLGGVFVHEKKGYNMVEVCNDPRAALVSSMLRRCLCRDPDSRFDASKLRTTLITIMEWRPGQARPDTGERRDRIRAAEDHAKRKSKINWRQNQFEEMTEILQTIKVELEGMHPEISEQKQRNRVGTHVHLNSFDSNAEAAYQMLTGKGVHDLAQPVSLIAAFVEFGPEPAVALTCNVLLWRDISHEHVVLVREDGSTEDLGRSFHGDLHHRQRVRDTVGEEIVRLQDLAIDRIQCE